MAPNSEFSDSGVWTDSKNEAEEKNPEQTSSWRVPTSGEHSDIWTRFLRGYYMPFLVRYNAYLLLMWFCVFIITVIYGPKFLDSTKSNLDLPKGTPSAEAIEAFSANYPELNSWAPAFVIAKSEISGQSVISAKTKSASEYLATYPDKFPSTVLSVRGYYEYKASNLDILANGQISDDGSTMITTVNFQKNTNLAAIYDVSEKLLKWSESYSNSEWSFYTTGIFPLFSEMQKQTSADFATIDEIVLPICIIILGLSLRSYRHMGIAFVNLVCTILLAFGILVPITSAVDINPFSPSILLSLGIAVCFDYSLFMLTRFKDERLLQSKSIEDSVFGMLMFSGHVVLLSGSTLFTTFIILLIFPQNFLQSVGYTCSVVVISSIIVNMNITPCMLLCCSCFSHFDPICFTKPHRSICCCVPKDMTPHQAAVKRREDLKERASVQANYFSRISYFLFSDNDNDIDNDGEENRKNQQALQLQLSYSSSGNVAAAEEECAQQLQVVPKGMCVGTGENHDMLFDESKAKVVDATQSRQQRSMWFRVTWFCTQHAKLVLLVLCGVTIPFIITFLNFTPTSDDYLIYLQTSRSLAGLKVMKSAFAEGRLNPYMAIITTGKANGVLTQDYFSTETTLVKYVLDSESQYVKSSGITSLTYFNGAFVTLADALDYMTPSTTKGATTTGMAYRLFAASLMNKDSSSSMVKMELSVAPNSQQAVPYIKSIRIKLKDMTSTPPVSGFPVKLYLFGGYTTTLDIQTALFGLVPIMIGVTCAIVLLLIGMSFGSVLLAVRLAFTVFISLCWTYGLMVLVYQPGKEQRDFAVLTPSILQSSGIYWIIPVMSFSILVGLALDYG